MSDSVCVGDEMRCVDPAVRVLCWCGMSPSVQIQNACGLAQVWGGRKAEEIGVNSVSKRLYFCGLCALVTASIWERLCVGRLLRCVE